MNARSLFAVTFLLGAGLGCRQQVVVYDCPDGSHPDATADGGVTPRDAGFADSGESDAGTIDSGEIDAGACVPFCFTGIEVSATVADVREAVTLTPMVEAQPGVQWTVLVDAAELVTERVEGRPALELTDIDLGLEATSTEAVFTVRDVPPWFFETRFVITMKVREVGRAVEQTQTASVLVRGNVLMSTGSEGHVYAVSSDGRPATGGGQYPGGALLDQLIDAPRAMGLAADGSLLVLDSDASPKRVRRFALTGADVLLSELQYQTTGAGEAIFRSGSDFAYSLAVLPDGRVAVPEYQFAGVSSAPKSRLLVWQSDGQYDREVWAPSPDENWRGAAVDADGKILVADRGLDIVSRYDPSTWLADGTFIDALPASPSSLHSTADALYVSGVRFILEAPWGGGRASVTGLPGSAVTWRSVTGYEGGRQLAVRDSQGSTGNVVLIENRQYARDFRAPGGPVVSIFGILYLR